MGSIAGFGALDHNVAVTLDVWEHLEKMLAELYGRLSQIVYTPEKVLLKYMSEACERHAEYIARLYYEYEAVEKKLALDEMREIDRASKRILEDLEEIYLKAKNILNPLELASIIEEVEKMCDIARDAYEILRQYGDGEAWHVRALIDMIMGETRIRREVLRELVKRLDTG